MSLPNPHPQQRVVLISGATSGIGRDTALLLARSGGYRVYAGYRDTAQGKALLEEAKKANLPLKTVSLDITDAESAQAAVDTAIKEMGRLDVLINNAGFGLAGAIEDLEVSEIKDQFETNVFGQMHLTKAALPHFRTQRSGTILFLSSMAGLVAYPLFGAYCASKHALEAFAESLRYELKLFGVKSILLEPGKFQTGFVKTNMRVGKNCENPDSAYSAIIKDVREKYYAEDEKAPSPKVVAKKILKIIEIKNPHLRYRVGADSQVIIFLKRFMPFRWFEAMVTKVLGMNQYAI
jgi:NAD(P)-dependent dehydrogenase (short-subunit alcohol dehydrogenase family)